MDNAFSNKIMDVSQLPHLESVTYHKLSPLYPKLVLVQVTLSFLFPTVIITSMLAIVRFSDNHQGVEFPIHWLIIAALLFYCLLLLLSYKEAKTKRYCLREHDLIFHHGLFARKTIVQPLLRVQHLEVSQNPLELRWGLASLKLFSAGGIRHTFLIPGLTKSQAEKLRQYVVSYQEKTHE